MEETGSLLSTDATRLSPRVHRLEVCAGTPGDTEVIQDPQCAAGTELDNVRVSNNDSIGTTMDSDSNQFHNSDIEAPDDIWRFNSFLVDLADNIDGEELNKLKALFIDIIGRGVMEKLKNARDLFDHLRKLTYLSRDNIVCLQSMLMKLNRPELIEMSIDYAKQVQDLVYFYPESGPVNGYRTVKIHVEGRDFQNYTQDYIRRLRDKLSHWLFIPPEHVLIAGIEPSSSMLFTVMIPDMYADILVKILRTQKDALQQLSELEIDTVQIGDTIFNIEIEEIGEAKQNLTVQQTKLVSVYQQLRMKAKQLDIMEHEVIKLTEENKTLEMETIVLKKLFELDRTKKAERREIIKLIKHHFELEWMPAYLEEPLGGKQTLQTGNVTQQNRKTPCPVYEEDPTVPHSAKRRIKRRKLEKQNSRNGEEDLDSISYLFTYIEETQGHVNVVRFIEECLKEVDRPDLQQQFQAMMKQHTSGPRSPSQQAPHEGTFTEGVISP